MGAGFLLIAEKFAKRQHAATRVADACLDGGDNSALSRAFWLKVLKAERSKLIQPLAESLA